MREYLTSNRTYYISNTGDDTATGSIDYPWKTIAHAYDWCQEHLDLCNKKLTFIITTDLVGSTTLSGPIVGQKSSGDVTFIGLNPNIVVSNIDSGDLFYATDTARFFVQNLTLRAPNGIGLVASNGTILANNLTFDEMSIGIDACSPSAIIGATNLTWLGKTFGAGITAEDNGWVNIGGKMTMQGSTFTRAFAQADLGGMVDGTGMTWEGSAKGRPYQAYSLGIVFTGNGLADPKFYPGDQPGQANPWVLSLAPKPWYQFWKQPTVLIRTGDGGLYY